jgi:hypothetical protein
MPSRETVWFVPLLVISLLVAMSLTIFLSPAIGVPLLAIAVIVGAVGRVRRHASATGRMQDFRQQAVETQQDGAPVQFDERDRQSLTPSQGEHTAR